MSLEAHLLQRVSALNLVPTAVLTSDAGGTLQQSPGRETAAVSDSNSSDNFQPFPASSATALRSPLRIIVLVARCSCRAWHDRTPSLISRFHWRLDAINASSAVAG